jgi:HD superfamily phosphohydrolase
MHVHDCVYHELITIPRQFRKLVFSPEFQRTKGVRQTGTLKYVYNSANHTRYEHMIGTAYLTQLFCRNLVTFREDGLKKEERDELYLAALLHDIGHAPFSHQFESQVCRGLGIDFSHEEQGTRIIEEMFDRMDIDNVDVSRITGLIRGDIVRSDKPWMSEIVANKRNCLDVDKFDYLQRDSFYIFGEIHKNTYTMLMNRPCVIDGEICYSSKYQEHVVNVFGTRMRMYRTAYMHHKVVSTGYMMADAILQANHVLNVEEILSDMSQYVNFDDDIINKIYDNDDVSLNKSREIINRVKAGNYYLEAGKAVNVPVPTIQELLQCNTSGHSIHADDVIIHSYKLNYGREMNPIYDVTFYEGYNYRDIVATKMEESIFHPRKAEEKILQVFCKKKKVFADVMNMTKTWINAHKSLGR